MKDPLTNTGIKHDQNKPTFDLLPFPALGQINAVLKYGADKYEANNWRRGMDWNRPWNASIRHLTAWQSGEDVDPETGLSHLAHAACNLLFLLTYEAEQLGTDDRASKPQP